MKKLFLINNPELFQGEKYLKANKNYFEGWYFKNINYKEGIAFIPGININQQEKKAFIQVITNNTSYFVDYDIEEFAFCDNPFYVKIGNSYFSKDNIHIEIEDEAQNLVILGDIKYSNVKNIDTNIFNPNIMGPFSYIPFMECNHAILSMKNKVDGIIDINNNKIVFDGGTGYIEKDWGYSFPKSYIWCQGNNFEKQNVSFMLAIADIPFKPFNFRGLICILMVDDKEFKFTTYNNAKIIEYKVDDNVINIVLKKGHYYLYLETKCDSGLTLYAPVSGKMEKDILESISAVITVTLKKDDTIIFTDTSTNCGLEIVNE